MNRIFEFMRRSATRSQLGRHFKRPHVQWAVSLVSGLAVISLIVLSILFFFRGPAQRVEATTDSFTETFATTTYKDSANTTAVWYGDGTANMGVGNVSSTIYEIVNPRGGVNNYDVQAISCTSATVCYLINEYNYPGPEVLKTTDGGTTWFSVHGGNFLGGTGATPYDIYAVWGTDVVYVLARGGAGGETLVVKTTDAGVTWSQQRNGLPSAYIFEAMTCSDVSTCVMVGSGAAHPSIYFTSNGGDEWTSSVAIVDETYAFKGVDFYNDGTSSTYRAVGTGGRLYVSKSTTTPYVWTTETSGTADTINDVRMTDYNNVYLVGGVSVAFIRKSGDAGANYAAQTSEDTRPIQAIDCDTATTSTCWAVSDWFESDGNIQKTTDGGGTWALVDDNGWSVAAYRTVEAVSDSIAYAAGVGTSVDANLVKTSTSTHFTNLYSNGLCSPNIPGCGGATTVVIPNDMAISPDGQTIFAVGDDGSAGKFGKTSNGGDTWSVLSAPGRATSIDCVSSSSCVAVGSGGAYHVTSDGGSNWATGATTTNLNDIDMTTTLAGWAAVSASPAIIRTEDGGSTWLNANTGLPSDFRVNDVWAVSTSSAYIAGHTATAPVGRIYYTGDSGATWTSKVTNEEGEFYKIHFLPDNSVGWAFTFGSGTTQVYSSTNGGATWAAVGSFENNNGVAYYTGIHFLDANVGFAATDQGAYLGITVNGGATWMRRRLVGAQAAIVAHRNTMYISGNANQGSYGLVYKVTVPYATSTLQSTAVDSTSQDLTCAGLTATQTLNSGTVTYEMSNDGGSTWTASGGSCAGMAHTNEFSFASVGSDLRWRATLSTPGSAPTTTPTVDELSISYAYNSAPDTPTNSSPSNGASNVLVNPTLTSSAFSDTEGDTHQYSRWEVTSTAGNYSTLVYGTTSTTSLVSLTLPSGTLTNNTTYYWHVRHVDSNSGYSSFSSETSFTTVAVADSAGGSTASTIYGSEAPHSPRAIAGAPGDTPQELLWTFEDRSNNEFGFSIVDSANGNAVRATTDPIFTQDIDRLTEDDLTPATEYCHRAVVAFNDKGTSPIVDDSTYLCAYTTPAPPRLLVIATTTPTTITFEEIPPEDGNPDTAKYRIYEETSNSWLRKSGAVAGVSNEQSDVYIAAATGIDLWDRVVETPPPAPEPLPTPTTTPEEVVNEVEVAESGGSYELSSEPTEQTAAEWGQDFVLYGLAPQTQYDFVAYAVNAAGDEARGQGAAEGTGITSGTTGSASVRFDILKTVTIAPGGAVLGAIASAADISLLLFGILSVIGVGVFVVIHRKSGAVRCTAGVCHLVLSPVKSYEQVIHPQIRVPYTLHRDVHQYARTALITAGVALVIKLSIAAVLVFNPARVFGATGPEGSGQSVIVGDTVHYEVRVRNDGPYDASGVTVFDALPTSISFVPGSLTVDGIRQTDLGEDDLAEYKALDDVRTVFLRTPRLAFGQTIVLTFKAVVQSPLGQLTSGTAAGTLGVVRNTACVRSTELWSPTCSVEVLNPIVDRRPPLNLNLNRNLPVANLPVNANQNTNTNQPIVVVPGVVRPKSQLARALFKTFRVNGLLPGAVLTHKTPVVTGYAPATDIVVLFGNQRPIGWGTAGTDGYYQIIPSAPLALGTYTFQVFDVLPTALKRLPVVLQMRPTRAPGRAIPIDTPFSRPTRERTPTVRGQTAPGATVEVALNGFVLATALADMNGTWFYTFPQPLPVGQHEITATDEQNQKETITYDVDLSAPVGPESEAVIISSVTAEISVSDPTPTLSGEAPPGTTVVIFVNDEAVSSAVANARGVWSAELEQSLPEGAVILAAAPTGGEITSGDITVIDPQATEITVNGAPPDVPTNDPTPEIEGAGPAGAMISLAFNGAVVGLAHVEDDGRFRFSSVTPFADGQYAVSVLLEGQELDSATMVVDTIPPVVPSSVGIEIVRLTATLFSRGRQAIVRVFGETSPETSRVHIRLQSDPVDLEFAPPTGLWQRDVSGQLDPGEHTVTVVAYDSAGNASAGAVRTFVVPEDVAGGPIAAIVATVAAFADTPAVERAAEYVVAPTALTISAVNTAAAVGTTSFGNYIGLLFTQPFLLFRRRRRYAYGVVYNALTKLPVDLAIVRLLNQTDGRVIQTKVTDKMGRYDFHIPPGQYRLEVVKQGFSFPSQYVTVSGDDVSFADVLAGNTVTPGTDGRVARNIPLDPSEDTRTPARIRAAAGARRVQSVIALSGPVLSLVTFAITPSTLVFVLLVLQCLAFVLFRRLAYVAPPKSYGVVRAASNGQPLTGVVVRIFDVTYNKLLEAQVTDQRGRYAFLVGQNQYYVTAEKTGFAPFRSGAIALNGADHGALVTRDIRLDPARPALPPLPTRSTKPPPTARPSVLG